MELDREVMNIIDRLLYERYIDIVTISSAPSIEASFANEAEKQIAVKRLKEFTFITGPWDSLFLVNTAGIITISTVQDEEGKNIITKPEGNRAYTNAMGDEVYYSDIVISDSTGKPTVIFAAPVKIAGAGNKEIIVGIVIGHLAWPVVLEIIENAAQNNSTLHLYNKNEVLIGDNEREHQKNILFTNHANEPILQATADIKVDTSVVLPTTAEVSKKENYLFSVVRQSGYLTYGGSDWRLIMATPATVAFAPARALAIKIAFFIAVLLTAGLLVLLFILNRSIVKPLQMFAEASQSIAAENFQKRVDIKTGDEIEQLAEEFNAMADKLESFYKGLQEKIKERTQELEEANRTTLTEKNKLQITLASIGDGAFVTDIDGRITFLNKITEELIGKRKEEVLGKSYREVFKFVREKDRSPNYTFIEDALIRNKISHIQNHTMLISKDGKEIPVADSAAPIRDSTGNVTGCIVVLRDVTREYAIDKAKTEFISLASHQLRTPLTGIKWSLETELDGSFGKLNEKQRDFLQNAYDAAQRMTILVNGLLNISRIETEKLTIKPESVNLPSLCENIINELSALAAKKKHRMQLQKSAALPNVITDPKLLHEVLINLLSNAIRYTPEEGTITLGLELRQNEILIAVKDNGLGIPKAQQHRVFEKFFRADNIIKIDTEGTGLGLYIVKGLVEILEGKIWFESEEKKGTTFFVAIPLKGIKEKIGEKSLA